MHLILHLCTDSPLNRSMDAIIYLRTYRYVQADMCVYLCVCVCVRVFVYVYVYVYECACVCVRVCIIMFALVYV